MLFKRALGPEIEVGVIAGTDDTYDANRWWMSVRGTSVIFRKLLGYLYSAPYGSTADDHGLCGHAFPHTNDRQAANWI